MMDIGKMDSRYSHNHLIIINCYFHHHNNHLLLLHHLMHPSYPNNYHPNSTRTVKVQSTYLLVIHSLVNGSKDRWLDKLLFISMRSRHGMMQIINI